MRRFRSLLDDGTKVGECTADQANLTCKVWSPTGLPMGQCQGVLVGRARLQEAPLARRGSIVLNGEVVKKLVWGDTGHGYLHE